MTNFILVLYFIACTIGLFVIYNVIPVEWYAVTIGLLGFLIGYGALLVNDWCYKKFG